MDVFWCEDDLKPLNFKINNAMHVNPFILARYLKYQLLCDTIFLSCHHVVVFM